MSCRKRIWFTSDQHFGHENVLKFCDRPFKTIEQMHRELIKRYNNCVGKNDICYFLGDVGMGKYEELKDIINQLNGTKILISGNHDRGINACYNLGFDSVQSSASILIGKEKVTLSHCPLMGVYRENLDHVSKKVEGENWHGESRSTSYKYSVTNEGQFHLHGHIHSEPNKPQSLKELGRQMDIGVDANNYMPVSISTIEKFINRVKIAEEAKNGKG